MSNLKTLQSDFQNYILDFDSQIQQQIINTKKVSARTRLKIYSDAYRLRLIEALQTDYPVLQILLGDEQFDILARDYIDAHPSHFRSVRDYGAKLSEFLQNDIDYAKQPILAEMAAFEWLLMAVFDAANSEVVDASLMANIPPESWAELKFKTHPSLRRIQLQWNVVDIWKDLIAEQEPQIPQATAEPVAWLVWRQQLQTHFRSLTVDEAWAIDAMLAGQNFGAICEGLCEWQEEQQVALHAASLLKTWLSEGLIVALE